MEQLSVSELCGYINAVLTSDPVVSDVWVFGEVSNCKRHSSGHWYLTLKEADARIDAVIWRSTALRLSYLPQDGMAILGHGKVELYNGRLQLYLDFITPAGEGLLQAQYERLKAQLEAEGLTERKRPLPLFPQRIGIVTSPTGAALQDMLNVLRRRFPLAEIIIAPALVQGEDAAPSIVEALYELFDFEPDVIIVARGGGSIEDLWAFNEEIVARAVFASPVPVVTGVGHETDTTIVDFVADLRAPTPSAAAELVTPDLATLRDELINQVGLLHGLFQGRLQLLRSELNQQQQQLLRHDPQLRLQQGHEHVVGQQQRLQRAMQRMLEMARLKVQVAERSLVALNPERTLARGYAVVLHAGRAITNRNQVAVGETVSIQLHHGQIQATIDELRD